jgi:hypothetical protein
VQSNSIKEHNKHASGMRAIHPRPERRGFSRRSDKKRPFGQATPKACCKKDLAKSHSKALGVIAASFTRTQLLQAWWNWLNVL